MDLITLLVILAVICFAFYANNKWVEMPFRLIVNLVLIIVTVVIVLKVSGVVPNWKIGA
jgi:hypothetical protein